MIKVKENLDEREFELINIIGSDTGSNQRDLSRQLNLSLGMVNMLIRRLISKGYIRIRQLNQRKVEYILTPRGFAEKMRKSVHYTLKTLNSINFIKSGIEKILLEEKHRGQTKFAIVGKSDLALLVEMVLRDVYQNDYTVVRLEEIPENPTEETVLICKEDYPLNMGPIRNRIHLVEELAKHNHKPKAMEAHVLDR